MSKREQVSVSFSDTEREILEKIATDLGRSVSAVVRDCAINGLSTVIQQYEEIMEARRKMNLIEK